MKRVFFLSLILSGLFYLFSTFLANEVFQNKNYGEYFIYLIGHIMKNNIEIQEVGYICETRLYGYSKTGSGIIKFIILSKIHQFSWVIASTRDYLGIFI